MADVGNIRLSSSITPPIDGTAEMARALPQVELVGNNVNLGFTKANNQALGVERLSYVLLLNPERLYDRGVEADA